MINIIILIYISEHHICGPEVRGFTCWC